MTATHETGPSAEPLSPDGERRGCGPDERPLTAPNRSPPYSRYLAEVGREMRQNLQDILKLVELALDSDAVRVQRDYLRNIRASTLAVLAQVEGLLDLARLQMGDLGLDQIPFNPAALLSDLAGSFASYAQERGLAIRCELADDLPTYSRGDPGRLRQVLTTLGLLLIGSAETAELRLCIGRMGREDPQQDWIELALSGLSQTPDRLQRLFDPLEDGVVAGPGFTARLQLDTCRRLIELLGGGIWIDGQETPKLRVRLPLARLEPPEPEIQPQGSWTGKRALIVDDHSEVRRTLACWLRSWGFAVEEAANGAEALERIRQQGLDLMIFDAVLPGLDGFKLAEQIKSEGIAGHTALVMLSSLGQRGDAKRCRALGIDAFLTKPVSAPELRELLGRTLGERRPSQQGLLITRHLLAEHRPRLRVLFVERDPVHQKLACALLKQRGHEPVAVADGDEALVQLVSANYDLVFIDLGLPPDSCRSLIQAIKRIQTVNRPFLIGMGATDSDLSVPPGLDVQITKPLTPQVLDELSQQHLDQGASS